MPPEVEFWGHCSNLQAWYEFEYNTKLLHRNLAFPLLKKLYEVGDPQAKKVFKDEILNRFFGGNSPVHQYIGGGGYLNFITAEEKFNLFELEEEIQIVKELEANIGVKFGLAAKNHNYGTVLILEDGKVISLSFFMLQMGKIPECVKKLKNLRYLKIEKCGLIDIPGWIGEVHFLKELILNDNKLKTFPESIGKLKSLMRLEAKENLLESIPRLICELTNLEVLILSKNKIRIIPESIGNLKNLRKFDLQSNKIYKVPASVNNLKHLKFIDLIKNPIYKTPQDIKIPLLLSKKKYY